MININIPPKFIDEKRYVLKIIFEEILGLEYRVTENINNKNYEIEIENGNKLIIEDHFFYKFNEELEYLNIKNIPSCIKCYKNNKFFNDEIIVLWGNNNIEINGNNVICEIDLLAATYFMLTRWEEYIIEKEHKYGTLYYKNNITYKNNIFLKPIVNEYIEIIWNILSYLGINQKRKKISYNIAITHDVDYIIRWKNILSFLKTIFADIFIRKNIDYFKYNMEYYYNICKNCKNDQYDSFDMLMDISENNNIKSHFFFQSATKNTYDYRYSINDKKTLQIIKNIASRNHIIGFHPSYLTYNNETLWKKEYNNFIETTKIIPQIGRQHYLNFENPTTWQIWDNNKMLCDSTLGYPDYEGFRSGICNDYTTFNIISKKVLKLKEMPLIAMDISFVDFQKSSPYEIIQKIKRIFSIIKKYNGNVSMLWHNSNLYHPHFKRYINTYNEIIQEIKN